MKKELSLDGEWELACFTEEEFSEEKIVNGESNLKWIKTHVPGEAQLTLLDNGTIKGDPFFGLNHKEWRKYEFYEWWYKKSFSIPIGFSSRRVTLHFDGIDTFGTVWLNGRLLGKTINMFVPYTFDITDIIKPDAENILMVRIASPINAVKGKEIPVFYCVGRAWERLWTRKAIFSYGSDMSPRLLTSGLWKSVSINSHQGYNIKDAFLMAYPAKPSPLSEKATLFLFYDLELPPEYYKEDLFLEVEGRCEENRFFSRAMATFTTGEVPYIEVEKPKLWWPHNLGQQNLYQVEVRLMKGKEILDKKTFSCGIRTIELQQEQEKNGKSFRFLINGEKTFVLGPNWISADAFPTRNKKRIPEILNLVKDMHSNIIRVNGDGIYEDESFYELCDRMGIMVWQDFMFSLAFYPQEEEFLNNVREEAKAVVKRLRNHPCIIIWCGGNEMQTELEDKVTGDVLKDTCQNLDYTRPYWSISPQSPSQPKNHRDPSEGDVHFYPFGKYFKEPFFSEYAKIFPRFIAETGHFGCPSLKSVKKFLPEDKIWPPDKEYWGNHLGSVLQPDMYFYFIKKLDDSMKIFFGKVPDNVEDYISASQILQAEALKFWVETARQKKWECGGIIWWNMIDVWPEFSTSIVDYYLEKKLVYYYLKTSQNPVLLSLGEPKGNKLPIFITNDTLEKVSFSYSIECCYPKGAYREKSGKGEIAPNSNKVTGFLKLKKSPKQAVFLLRLDYSGKREENHYLYGKPPFNFKDYKNLMHVLRK